MKLLGLVASVTVLSVNRVHVEMLRRTQHASCAVFNEWQRTTCCSTDILHLLLVVIGLAINAIDDRGGSGLLSTLMVGVEPTGTLTVDATSVRRVSVLARGESPLRGDRFVTDAANQVEIHAAGSGAKYFVSKISLGTGLLKT